MFAFPKKRRNSQLALKRDFHHRRNMVLTMIVWRRAVDLLVGMKRMTLKIRTIMSTIRIELANIYTHLTMLLQRSGFRAQTRTRTLMVAKVKLD